MLKKLFCTSSEHLLGQNGKINGPTLAVSTKWGLGDGGGGAMFLTCQVLVLQYLVHHVGGQQIRPCEVVLVSYHVPLLLHWSPVLGLALWLSKNTVSNQTSVINEMKYSYSYSVCLMESNPHIALRKNLCLFSQYFLSEDAYNIGSIYLFLFQERQFSCLVGCGTSS